MLISILLFLKFCTDRKIRTSIKGFGDPYATVAPYPCVVIPTGFEPVAHTLKVYCSNQLSYEIIIVEPTRIELVPSDFQSDVRTSYTKIPYVGIDGLEPSTFTVSG
jgi:hypothetical protein